jgi:1,4-dihydroxy-2-naphthoate polyprenyltransferase
MGGRMLKTYLKEIFEPTILFGFFTALVGAAAARYYGNFNLIYAVLVVLGVVMAQIAVNIIDDYVDYEKGLDRALKKTKFSGGSDLIGKGKGRIPPLNALGLGLFFVVLALVIGVFLAVTNPVIVPIMIIGGVSVILYAKFFVNVPFLSEPLTILNFTLVCFGAFVVVGHFWNTQVVYDLLFIFIPAGIVPATALLANSVPDRDIDAKYGRKHGLVMLKTNRKAALYYISFQSIAYALLIAGIVLRYIPVAALMALGTVPMSAYVFAGILGYTKPEHHEKFMGLHADTSLLFLFLLFLAFLI